MRRLTVALTGLSLLLAACTASHPTAVRPSETPSTSPSPTVTEIERKGLAPAEAHRLIRATVTGSAPVLLPVGIPPTWVASVTANSDFFSIEYRSKTAKQSVTLAIVVANIPLPQDVTKQTSPRFHGDPHSFYQAEDPRDEGTRRWLEWTETGHSAPSLDRSGVPYLLSSNGVTEFDFWRIARSLSAQDIEPYGDEPQIPYAVAPRVVRLPSDFTMLVPAGWYGQKTPQGSAGVHWELTDHDPATTSHERLRITLLADPASDAAGAPACPASEEETRIDYCGFVNFGERHWRHIIGETDIPFTEFVTVAEGTFFRLIGFYPKGDRSARLDVEAIMRRSVVPVVRECSDQQVTLGLGGDVSEATGQNTTLLVIRNRSSRPCWLRGYPAISILDAHRRSLPFRYQDHGDQMITNDAPSRVKIEPGARAYLGINKYRCDVGSKGAGVEVVIVLPGSSPRRSIAPHEVSLDYCGANDPGSLVSISPIEQSPQAVLGGSATRS